MTLRTAAALTTLAALAAAPTAAAQEMLTPDGPATLRANWLGPSTSEGLGPNALVGWRVTVGPGGRAGRVRLRVVSGGKAVTSRLTGPFEWLPAEPGTYEFRVPPPTFHYDYRTAGLALDQEVGGHGLVEARPRSQNAFHLAHAMDVFRPPLAPDARDVPYSERQLDVELRLDHVVEADVDRDGFGDTSHDAGDLRLLRAIALPRRGGRLLLRARVRNAGSTVRNLAGIATPRGTRWLGCPGRRPYGDWFLRFVVCRRAPLQPGAEADLSLLVRVARRPTHLRVVSEGPDLRPADNRRRVR